MILAGSLEHILERVNQYLISDFSFTDIAEKALEKAKTILDDSAKCRGYLRWLEEAGQGGADDSELQAERARREVESKRLEELERQLAAAEERAREAVREKQQLERQAEARRQSEKERQSYKKVADSSEPAIPPSFRNFLEENIPQPTPPEPPRLINISGAWASSDGFTYHFVQVGNAVRMNVTNLFGVIVSEGEGVLTGQRLIVNFRALTPPYGTITHGRAEAEVSPDGRNIHSFFQNFDTFTNGTVYLSR